MEAPHISEWQRIVEAACAAGRATPAVGQRLKFRGDRLGYTTIEGDVNLAARPATVCPAE